MAGLETYGLHAVITPPHIVGEHVYGVESYGEVRALDARTGERLWWMSGAMTPQARWGGVFIVRQGIATSSTTTTATSSSRGSRRSATSSSTAPG